MTSVESCDLAARAADSILTGLPAFILGNGPRLPVDDLDCLDHCFTIGVNRILEVYTPTVLLWVDGSIFRENGHITPNGRLMDQTEALKVCDKSVWERQGWIGLKTWVGDSALKHKSKPDVLCCRGNTGCTAARWALALGCRPVYLIGMSATYQQTGGLPKTDFYGVNKWHRRVPGNDGTLMRMRSEADRLKRDFPADASGVLTGERLRRIAGELAPVDGEAIKAEIREVCQT